AGKGRVAEGGRVRILGDRVEHEFDRLQGIEAFVHPIGEIARLTSQPSEPGGEIAAIPYVSFERCKGRRKLRLGFDLADCEAQTAGRLVAIALGEIEGPASDVEGALGL